MKIFGFLQKFSRNYSFPNTSRKCKSFLFCEHLNLRERQNRKGKTGQSEQDRQTGQAERDTQNRTSREGDAEQDSQSRNSRTEQAQQYTVRKGQCKFKLRKHDTYHMMGISTLCNVKMCDISANVE